MSKGRKSKTLRGSTMKTIIQPRGRAFPMADRANDGGANVRGTIKELCWDFRLVEVTAVAVRGLNNMPITGHVRSGRVGVSASVGLLGFAPDEEAQRIIQAAKNGGRLEGNVTTREVGERGPTVRLCLREV